MIWKYLTPRQKEIANLLLGGTRPNEIEKVLGLSAWTLREELAYMYEMADIDKKKFHLNVRLVYLLWKERNEKDIPAVLAPADLVRAGVERIH